MPHKLSESDENDPENPMQAFGNPSNLDSKADDGDQLTSLKSIQFNLILLNSHPSIL